MTEPKPYITALTGIKAKRNYDHIRVRYEPNKYYEVRAMIMKECYLEGWNPKEIIAYFNITLKQFYKFCSVRQIKIEKNRMLYLKMCEQ